MERYTLDAKADESDHGSSEVEEEQAQDAALLPTFVGWQKAQNE